MIQTNYVALEHPYRVIYYNGVMGLQIGTLIVTVEKQDEEGRDTIEMRSHPVVSYCSVETKKGLNLPTFPGCYSEAVVWDQVQQNDVATLCVEGENMHIVAFINYIAEDLWKKGLKNGMGKSINAAYDIRTAMKRLSIDTTIPKPENGLWKESITLGLWEEDSGVQMCGDVDTELFRFETPVDQNEEKMVEALLQQQDFWGVITGVTTDFSGPIRDIVIDFKPCDDTPMLVRLTKRLNEEQEKRVKYLFPEVEVDE